MSPKPQQSPGDADASGTAAPTRDAGGRIDAHNPPRAPFENTRDSRFYYPSAAHREALSRLLFLARDRNMGIGLLTGEIGAGKTLLRTLLYAQLADDAHMRVSIENSLLDFDGLLLEILSQMLGGRVQPERYPDRYTRLAAFKQLLSEQIAARDRHLVILVDEAQLLDAPSLEGLKGLTNIASERQNFLTLILIGQPELRAQLKHLPQVDQRVSLRFHLGALTVEETAGYVLHRLEMAGYRGPAPFDDDAIELLHGTSRGIPREINRLCKLALEHIVTRSLGRLDTASIAVVIEDLRRHGALGEVVELDFQGLP